MSNFLDPVEHSLASKGIRFANFIIDYIVLLVIMVMIVALFMVFGMESALAVLDIPIVGNLIGILIYFTFIFVQEAAFKGRSIGKFITGTQAVMLDGSEATLNAIFIRSISRCVPFEVFSFFGTTGWHDAWSKTRVVNKKEFEQNMQKFSAIDQIGAQS